MDLENNQGSHARHFRRVAPAWTLFVVGLCGVLAGGLLVYFILVNGNRLADPGDLLEEELPPAKERQTPLQPPKDDLAIVEVVDRVMPAVVAVNSYVPGSYFGRNVLVQSGSGSGPLFQKMVILSRTSMLLTMPPRLWWLPPIHAASKLLWSERIV